MHPMLTIAVKAARRAGSVIVRHLDLLDRISVDSKGRNDFVTEVDRMAEQEIIQIIQRAYPSHSILGEESGATAGDEFEWVIDPLDGTTNFIHGFPQFAVSIAVRVRGRLDVGCVFDPLRNELYTAVRGQGAQLNGRRMRVSRAHRLEDCLLGTGFPFRSVQRLDEWMGSFRELVLRTRGIRRAGAAALDLASVACGRFDGFWETGLSPWDLAAGVLLIEEAGGMVADFDGEAGFMESGNLIAASPGVFNELSAVVTRHFNAPRRAGAPGK
jgi:myo-inositol-1(or 4)-monophosphatase